MMIPASIRRPCWLPRAHRPAGPQPVRQSFAGIHQLSWFDLSLLIPYFAVLGILSVYGLHRYARFERISNTGRTQPKSPAMRFEQLPRGHHSVAHLQRALCHRAADRRSDQNRVSARNCCRFRCSTIRPTTPTRTRRRCASATARSGSPSSITTARIARGSRPGRWPKA